MSMDNYGVVIGEDTFKVKSSDNQGARYEASVLFKKKYKLNSPLSEIAQHAKAKLVSGPESFETTEKVLKSLGGVANAA